jgi:hypothetical protein
MPKVSSSVLMMADGSLLALPDCVRTFSRRGCHVLAHKAETGELRTARVPALPEYAALLRALKQLGCRDLTLQMPGFATAGDIIYECCTFETDPDESCATF